MALFGHSPFTCAVKREFQLTSYRVFHCGASQLLNTKVTSKTGLKMPEFGCLNSGSNLSS